MVYNFRYVQVESFDTCGLCCVGYQTILFVSVDVVMRALFIKPGHEALCLKNLSLMNMLGGSALLTGLPGTSGWCSCVIDFMRETKFVHALVD
jgi:hypothetical protein